MRSRLAGGNLGDTLRGADVTFHLIGPYFIHNQFIGLLRSLDVEDNRLVHAPVLLFNLEVVNGHGDGKAIALQIGLLQIQAHVGNLSGLTFVECEFEVLTLTRLPQVFDVVMVPGNQRAQFTAGHTQVRRDGVDVLLGRVEIGLGQGNVLSERADLLLIRLLRELRLELLGLLALLDRKSVV